MKHADLIARLEKLTGPDREVDADLDVVLLGGETVWLTANYTMEVYPATRRPSANHVGGFVNGPVPPFTASLDAAVALVERMLPGWTIANIGQDDRKHWHAELRQGFLTSFSTVKLAGASTPAIALLMALLRALQESDTAAKESDNG